jgi:predicted nucleic acid-binding protein
MITAIDTNIVVALWDNDPKLSATAQLALDRALARGGLVISAPVFAELLACPGRDEAFLNTFLTDTGMTIDWELDESVWRVAGRAFQGYVSRRRRQGDSGPRRILADFVIGAHASERGCELLTLDDRLYKAAFPGLRIGRI